MAKKPKDILDEIKEKEVKYVDVRFTDMRGKMQHVTFDIDLVDDDFLSDGTTAGGPQEFDAWSKADVIVVNHVPIFSPALPNDLMEDLRHVFPHDENIGAFEVRWR